MRKEFADSMIQHGRNNEKLIFLTGDLGFMALEEVQSAMGHRFVNAGVSEQNMVAMAAGFASEGLTAICYSIAPFLAFRPTEQIRLDVCLHNMDVKLVGNGGGYGYGIMGATHHALEDIAVLSAFQHMTCVIPFCNADVSGCVDYMLTHKGPHYLRLGFGQKPKNVTLTPFQPIRLIARGNHITIIGMGPMTLNALLACDCLGISDVADVFAVSVMPLPQLSSELITSISKTQNVLVVEEHVSRGGLAEHLALQFLTHGITPKMTHLCAHGYPDGMYGSQGYHQRRNNLDPVNMAERIHQLVTLS